MQGVSTDDEKNGDNTNLGHDKMTERTDKIQYDKVDTLQHTTPGLVSRENQAYKCTVTEVHKLLWQPGFSVYKYLKWVFDLKRWRCFKKEATGQKRTTRTFLAAGWLN